MVDLRAVFEDLFREYLEHQDEQKYLSDLTRAVRAIFGV